MAEAFDQVGVADIGPPEGDEVGGVPGHRLLGRLERVAAVAHERALEHAPKLCERHRLAERVKPEGEPVHDMEVGEAAAVEHRGDVRELLAEVGRAHVIEDAVG